ncbi:MAG: hypothetical protein ACI936_000440, partial [Paraglaciecola sp.]
DRDSFNIYYLAAVVTPRLLGIVYFSLIFIGVYSCFVSFLALNSPNVQSVGKEIRILHLRLFKFRQIKIYDKNY